MRSLFLLAVVLVLLGQFEVDCGFHLRWHPKYRPPDNLAELSRFENPFIGPIDIILSQSLCVQLVVDDTEEIIEFTGDFSAQSISRNTTYNVQNGIPGEDTWDGKFCNQDIAQKSGFGRWEHYVKYVPICGEKKNNFTISLFKMKRGEYYHRNSRYEKEGFKGDTRFIRFSMIYNETYIYLDSPDFEIHDLEYLPNTPEFITMPNTTVIANNPVTVGIRVANNENETIKDTLYSRIHLITTVSNTHGLFSFLGSGGLRMVSTDCVLGGPDVYVHPTDEKRIKSQFHNGTTNVTFQMEDIGVDFMMNFTLKLHVYTYRRYPENEYLPFFSVMCSYYYFELTRAVIVAGESNSTHLKYKLYKHNPAYFRSVKLLNFTVLQQTPAALRIVLGQYIKPKQIANFEVDNPIQVELLDVNGYRVTSGPDSNLAVTTFSNVAGVFISTDGAFNLKRGVGTFPGSITKLKDGVTLAFSVSSSVGVLSSGDTSSFDVVGNWNFVMLGSIPQKEMIEAAFQHGWKYYWQGIRSVNFHLCNSKSEVYDRYITGLNNGAERIIGMFAPDTKDEVKYETYVAIGSAFDTAVLGYTNTDSKYSNKKQHKLFKRVSFSDAYRYATIGSALKSRNWNRLVVITDVADHIPNQFVFYCSLFEIFNEEIKFPSVPTNATVLSKASLDSVFNKVAEAKTKLIWSFLTGPALTYLLVEAVKRGFTPANGYTWLGEDNMIEHFPYGNENQCGTLNGTTCIEAFRGAIMFKTTYPTDGYSGKNWGILAPAFSDKHLKSFDLTRLGDEDERINAILAYDVGALLVMAFRNYYNNHLTVTGERLLDYMDKICDSCADTDQILSGRNVRFDENNDRRNYTGYILQIDPVGGATGKDNVLKKKKFIHLGELPVSNVTGNHTITEFPIAGETFIHASIPVSERNTISFKTFNTEMNLDFSYTNAAAVETLTPENIPPAFYCTGGCGGTLLSTENHVYWSHGTCISQDVCQCNIDPLTGNPGFVGANCETPQCSTCIFGACTSPSNCVCDAGYVNSVNTSDCGLPTCFTHGCDLTNGECTAADFCKCKAGYYGKDCSKLCNCKNGKCSDGESGSGQCTCDSGYIDETCNTHQATIVAPTVIGVLLVLALLFVIGRHKYKQMQLMAQLMSTDWKADWDNIRMRQTKQKSTSLMSLVSMMSGKIGKQEEKIVSQNQGIWNGKEVVAKMIRKDDIEVTDEIRWEIKQMRDLRHPNLCLFVGACVDNPHICILNEVCGKGSLEDLLSKDDVELGWEFRYSMLKDICRGMSYLIKSDLKSHGRLKTSNCLVDNRWTVKLADYGMKTFKRNQYGVREFSPDSGVGVERPTSKEMDGCDYFNLLWTAPEIVATGVSHPDHVGYGTAAGDVYSFAIIMVQMCTRHHPYHELEHLTPSDIVQMVGRLIKFNSKVTLVESKDSEGLGIKVLRPQVNDDDLPIETEQAEGLRNLIQVCWNQDLVCRPSFDDCMKRLNTINPHRGELMDNLIVLMEHYTNSLEAIVAERTCDLKEEKEKGDLLLSKMLPPLIAEELKSGNNPKPEYFNCVTIYFSDVVGFGKLCAEASPYQVVELLNELYSVMDDVIETFDCYKVETIGDCYVVVSGLPVRNGDNHAGEIASMALQLLTTYNGVGYKHLHGSQVQLRIGMHSGPCVAGVVGLKMPRYCLFGDTVNTASRMESGGFALKIHLSEDTYKILDQLGGYQCESRGERQVKGRGTMTTYWLTGKDGADFNLPHESLALSASQHDFK